MRFRNSTLWMGGCLAKREEKGLKRWDSVGGTGRLKVYENDRGKGVSPEQKEGYEGY